MKWRGLLSEKRLRDLKNGDENGKDLKNDDENGKDPRNGFESDYGRITFSPAIRRMHDKTQVMPLTTDDHVHSRLTHSLEVMTIGYSLGIRLCENEEFKEKLKSNGEEGLISSLIRKIPIILQNACLVHDIGNPPFGHFGETSIQTFFTEYFKKPNSVKLENEREKEDFLHFDGNAQGFRILTKLQILDDDKGLNLTSATLSSSLKYPNTESIDKEILSSKKRGVFQSEKNYLKEISAYCGTSKDGKYMRHPLSFLMEAADSISYRVMDLEDGFNKGWYDFNFLEKFFSENQTILSNIKKRKLEKSEVSKIVRLRIDLIEYLVDLSIKNFIKNYDEILSGTYNKELIQDDKNNVEEDLKRFCVENIFTKREIQSLELTGDTVLKGLLEKYISYIFNDETDKKVYQKRAVSLISNSIIKAALLENKKDPEKDCLDSLDNYYKMRVIVDFISGMTDQFALSHYQKLSGQKIN